MNDWKAGQHYFNGSRTLVMGIVNVTPDSFSDGGRYLDPAAAVKHALRLQEEGADILDIGGQSTRPGSKLLTPEEELSRIEPVVEALRGRLRVPLSIDTFYPDVAERTLALGADIVNDVSGKVTPAMAAVVAKTGAGWVLTETQGNYGPDIAGEVAARLADLASSAEGMGVGRNQLCLDPGFGFEKDAEQNLELLRGLDRITALGYPLLAGVSRKRFIGALTGVEQADQRDPGSMAVHLLCLQKGACIVRAHNVSLSLQMARVWDGYRKE